MFRYCYEIVGCTIVDNSSTASYQGRKIRYSNCLVLNHTGTFGVKDSAYATNCVFSCKETEFNASDKCEFGVTDHVFLAPSFGDYRLLSGSAAVGCGDASLTKRISIYNPIAAWKEYIEEKYYYRDFYGNEIPETGMINCGAIQESVNPEGGCVVFYGDDTVQWETK